MKEKKERKEERKKKKEERERKEGRKEKKEKKKERERKLWCDGNKSKEHKSQLEGGPTIQIWEFEF